MPTRTPKPTKAAKTAARGSTEAKRGVAWREAEPPAGSVVIYGLCEPDTERIRYVGKAAQLRRRYEQHLRDRGQTHRHRWIASLRRLGTPPGVFILEYASETEWQETEKRWIARLRSEGHDLVNLTDGGDGTQGCAVGRGRPKSRLFLVQVEMVANIRRCEAVGDRAGALAAAECREEFLEAKGRIERRYGKAAGRRLLNERLSRPVSSKDVERLTRISEERRTRAEARIVTP